MKNFFASAIAMTLSLGAILFLNACQKEDNAISDAQSLHWRSGQNSVLYPPSARPFGKAYDVWAQEFWKAAFSLDCETFGNFQLLELSENVVGLFGPLGDETIDITISRDQVLFFPMITSLWDYPCAEEYGFEPPPGQSLEEFLQEIASGDMDQIVNLEAVFNGVAFENLNDHRFLTDLYYFTANPELTCVDPCITGESQAAVTDGYFLMFKKMQPGEYTLTSHGEWPEGPFEWTLTINITVE